MAERYFLIGEFNTFFDWNLILTAKSITPPEPKTYYVEIDGADGSLDLSEALSGATVYKDRTISATFWTNHGTKSDRVRLLQEIRSAIHGKKLSIIEPDDPDHYFTGRVKITGESNNLAYAEISIEATCEPYRYSNENITRYYKVNGSTPTDLVIHNFGTKTLSPTVIVTGKVTLAYNGGSVTLTSGSYKVADLNLYHGANVIHVSGSGGVTFEYKEAFI